MANRGNNTSIPNKNIGFLPQVLKDPVLLAFIFIPLVTLAIFLIVPVALMLKDAFLYNGEFSFYWFKNIFSSKKYINLNPETSAFRIVHPPNAPPILMIEGKNYGVILNSLINSLIVTVIATLIGLVVAFIFARYEFPGKTVLRVLATIPLLVTPFINAYVVKRLFLPNGLFSYIFYDVLHILPWRIGIDGLAGVTVTQIMTFYPIAYLNIYSSLINIDPSLEEQAENLGAEGFRLFRTITLPLAMPGIAAGATLIFIFSLEDLGAPIVFHSHPLARNLISYQIYDGFLSLSGQRMPEVAALAVILLVIAFTGFLAIRHYVSLKSYAMVSRGGRWKPRVRKLGTKGILLIFLGILPLILVTVLPQFGVVATAFSDRWTGPLPQGFNTENMYQIFVNPDVRKHIFNSIFYSFSALAIIIVLATMSSYAVSRARIPGVSILDALVTIPIAMPGLVVAVGYFYFFSMLFPGTSLDPTNPLAFNPAPILILAYAIRKLPFTARAVYAGLQQTHVVLEEAAMNLGASRLRTIATIVIPLILVNIISGAMISFVYSMTEVSVSITIGALNRDKAPLTYYMKDSITRQMEAIQITAALGVLLIIIQLAVITIITLVFKQRYAFIGV